MNRFLLALLLVTVLLLTSVPVTAGTAKSYHHGRFEAETTVVLFGDKVNLRGQPNPKAPLVAQLPIGSVLTIKGEPRDTFELNGFLSNWYQVEVASAGQTLSGFVWGGFISLAAVSWSEDGSDLQLLIGIEGLKDDGFTGKAKVLKGGQIISQLSFPLVATDMSGAKTYSYGFGVTDFEVAGFPSLKRLFSCAMTYEACGYENGERLLCWNGKDLILGPLASSISEAGIFHVASDFVFPGSEDVKDNQILVKTTETLDEEKKATEKRQLFLFNGKTWSEGPKSEKALPFSGE